MERLTGWFWKGSSKAGDKQEIVTSEKNEKESEAKQKLKLANDSQQADSVLNKNNSAQTSVTDSIKPVLFEKTNLSLIVRLSLWLQKNTYLQPEDCLTCKLTLTGFATLLFLTGLNVYQVFYKRRGQLIFHDSELRRLKTAKTVGYGSMFAMFGIFLYGEWFNALVYPPGDKPRSFLEREVRRMNILREALQLKTIKENDSGKTD